MAASETFPVVVSLVIFILRNGSACSVMEGRLLAVKTMMVKATKKRAAKTRKRDSFRRGVSARIRTAELEGKERDSKAKDKSLVDWKRCSGFFSRQRKAIRSSACGTIGSTSTR